MTSIFDGMSGVGYDPVTGVLSIVSDPARAIRWPENVKFVGPGELPRTEANLVLTFDSQCNLISARKTGPQTR